jgi:hypothetical protein
LAGLDISQLMQSSDATDNKKNADVLVFPPFALSRSFPLTIREQSLRTLPKQQII